MVEGHHYICTAVPNCMELGGAVGVTNNILRRLTVEQYILLYKAGGT